MPHTPLLLPGRVEEAALALARLPVFKSGSTQREPGWADLGGGAIIILEDDAIAGVMKIKALKFTKREAIAGIRLHLEKGRLQRCSYSGGMSSLEPTLLWWSWLQEQQLQDGPIGGNQFRDGENVARLTPRQYTIIQSSGPGARRLLTML